MSWADIKYGLDHLLTPPETAIRHAISSLEQSTAPQSEEVQLAGLSNADSVIDFVSALSAREVSKDESIMRDRWLFLVLAWLFENKEGLPDPLAVVEAVYSDFNYPHSMSSFVGYMPMQGSDLGSPEKNKARLLKYWEDYLGASTERFR